MAEHAPAMLVEQKWLRWRPLGPGGERWPGTLKLNGLLRVAATFWAVGFLVFATFVPGATCRLTSAAACEVPKVDAVVVFTGPQMARIAAGFRLAEAGTAPLLRISGVWEGSNEEQLRRLAGSGSHGTGVVSIDHAHNTRENVSLTVDWVKRMRVRSLLLVTSDYHMPRAEWLLRSSLPPDIMLKVWPVPTGKWLPIEIFMEYNRLLEQIVRTALGQFSDTASQYIPL
jgi:uncharacterized SAM-binding protein YcdF (DUF218 family)